MQRKREKLNQKQKVQAKKANTLRMRNYRAIHSPTQSARSSAKDTTSQTQESQNVTGAGCGKGKGGNS